MASNLDNFNRSNVEILQKLGFDVTLASNFRSEEDTNSKEKIESFVDEMHKSGVNTVQIDFSRHIGNVIGQIKSYKQVKNALDQDFDIIHCHSPICAAMTRLCAKKHRKRGAKVLYTAHGFHFYSGAPIKNWLLFYPVEKYFSKFTDVLITINQEDYKRAKRRLKAKNTYYIPGVGVDTKRYIECNEDRKTVRRALGCDAEDYIIVSVGEINDNKNHQTIIQAINNINDEKIKYVIVGKGELENKLKELVSELKLDKRVIMTGFRTDVNELLHASDCFAFPSKREGLGLAAIEAMSAGLPVIGHDIGGIRDFVKNGETGWLCKSNGSKEYTHLIEKTIGYEWEKENLQKMASKFDKSKTNIIMTGIYTSNV